MLLIIVMYALFAAEFPLAKFALRETNAFFLEIMRMIIGGALLLGYQWVSKKPALRIAKADWGAFVQLVVFYMYLSYFSAGWALQYMSSLKANMLYSLVPFVSAFLAYVILQDRLTFQKILGMLVGVVGFVVMFMGSDVGKASRADCMHIALPEIMMLVSIFSTEYGYFLLKRLYDKGYPIIAINGWAMFGGGMLSLMSAYFFFDMRTLSGMPVVKVCGYAILLFCLVNLVDIVLYARLIKKHSITFLTFASFLSPVFGVIYGTIFMGESISIVHGGAFGLVFLGLYLFSKGEKAQQAESTVV